MFDLECLNAAMDLYETYGWRVVDAKSLDEVRDLQAAAQEIESWFNRHGGNGQARMRAHMAPIEIADAGVLFTSVLRAHHVEGRNVYFLDNPHKESIVHEMGHVLDNLNGTSLLASISGGGPSDEMSRALGMDPELCAWRFRCSITYKDMIDYYAVEKPPSNYSYNGPSEDFAESFKYSVLDPGRLGTIRATWMSEFASSLSRTRHPFDRDDVVGVFVPLPIPECSIPRLQGTPTPPDRMHHP